jgi:hypothetical protein
MHQVLPRSLELSTLQILASKDIFPEGQVNCNFMHPIGSVPVCGDRGDRLRDLALHRAAQH